LDSYLCIPVKIVCSQESLSSLNAEVAHLVEHDLAKVGVAGSSPVFRSKEIQTMCLDFLFERVFTMCLAPVVELVDTQDLKSCDPKRSYGFDSRLGHFKATQVAFFVFILLDLRVNALVASTTVVSFVSRCSAHTFYTLYLMTVFTLVIVKM
jgi:hypothetical protein